MLNFLAKFTWHITFLTKKLKMELSKTTGKKRARQASSSTKSVENELDSNSFGHIELQDISMNRAKSTKKLYCAAMNHFDKYMLYVTNNQMSLAQLAEHHPEKITKDLVGKFTDYLFRVAKIETIGTAHDYLSSAKTNLSLINSAVHAELDHPVWYRKLRHNVKAVYIQDCVETGKPISTAQGSMTEDHLDYICTTLFAAGSRNCLADRCLLAFNWQCVGRISEVATLRWKNISFHHTKIVQCMEVGLHRMKTGAFQSLRVFMHHHSWAVCPFHALATMIVCRPDVSEHLFHRVEQGGEAGYVNRLLKYLFQKWEADDDGEKPEEFEMYTSHAQRHGSAETANEHPEIQTQWLVQRGAWSLESIQTVFNYIAGTAKSDCRIARVLAGWPSANAGGMAPGSLQMKVNLT